MRAPVYSCVKAAIWIFGDYEETSSMNKTQIRVKNQIVFSIDGFTKNAKYENVKLPTQRVTNYYDHMSVITT